MLDRDQHFRPRVDKTVQDLWLIIASVAVPLILLAAYAFDEITSHTELITPINPIWHNIMRLLGVLGGFFIAFVWFGERDLAFYRKAILFSVITFGGYALGDGIAWRVANYWEFVGSTAPYTTTRYAIVSVKGGNKSRTYALGIDPYDIGQPAEIDIPYAQYRSLVDGGFSDLCVSVDERRAASGAIQVRTLPANRAPGEEAEIARCG